MVFILWKSKASLLIGDTLCLAPSPSFQQVLLRKFPIEWAMRPLQNTMCMASWQMLKWLTPGILNTGCGDNLWAISSSTVLNNGQTIDSACFFAAYPVSCTASGTWPSIWEDLVDGFLQILNGRDNEGQFLAGGWKFVIWSLNLSQIDQWVVHRNICYSKRNICYSKRNICYPKRNICYSQEHLSRLSQIPWLPSHKKTLWPRSSEHLQVLRPGVSQLLPAIFWAPSLWENFWPLPLGYHTGRSWASC